MDKPLKNSSVQVKDLKTGMDFRTKHTIKKLTRKNKNKGLLQLSMIICISNSTFKLRKGATETTGSMQKSREVPPQHRNGKETSYRLDSVKSRQH